MGERANPIAEFQALDSYARTPLHIAAEKGDLAEIKQLLDKGLDPNAVDKSGGTPLNAAAGSFSDTRLEAVKLLIDKGANPNARDEFQRTELHGAAFGGADTLIEVLISKGADPRAVDDRGRTPMHQAADAGHIDTMVLLVEKGGSLTTKDKEGKTPIKLLEEKLSPKELEEAKSQLKEALVKKIKSASVDDKSQAYQDLAALGPAQGNAMVASNDKPSAKALNAIPNMQATARGEGRG